MTNETLLKLITEVLFAWAKEEYEEDEERLMSFHQRLEDVANSFTEDLEEHLNKVLSTSQFC
jgi:hypothetical protein